MLIWTRGDMVARPHKSDRERALPTLLQVRQRVAGAGAEQEKR